MNRHTDNYNTGPFGSVAILAQGVLSTVHQVSLRSGEVPLWRLHSRADTGAAEYPAVSGVCVCVCVCVCV